MQECAGMTDTQESDGRTGKKESEGSTDTQESEGSTDTQTARRPAIVERGESGLERENAMENV